MIALEGEPKTLCTMSLSPASRDLLFLGVSSMEERFTCAGAKVLTVPQSWTRGTHPREYSCRIGTNSFV